MNAAPGALAGATLRGHGAGAMTPPPKSGPNKGRHPRMDEAQMATACERSRRTLAVNLRAARGAAGLTQQAIQDMTGVGAANISRIEAAVWNVSIDTVAKIAAAVGVETGWLLTHRDPDPPEN